MILLPLLDDLIGRVLIWFALSVRVIFFNYFMVFIYLSLLV